MLENGSKMSTVPVVWANLDFFRRDLNDFCRDWWPWTKPGYITMTRIQCNNQWSGGITVHPVPKNSEYKNPLEKFSPRFFILGGGSRRHPPHWLSSTGPNYQRGVLLIFAGDIEGHFEKKTTREDHKWILVLARQCTGSPGTYNPHETGQTGLPVSWSHTLFSGSDLVGLPPVPWTERTIERSPFFVRRGGHCCHGDLVGRTSFWFFFEWLAKVRATG